jgi:predicted metal-dependent hydrolase
MPEKIIQIENIGNVRFRKNKSSKNVSITIRPEKGVVVTFPYFLSYKFALNVVEKKRSWILNHLPKIEEYNNKRTIFNEDNDFNTRYRKLVIGKNTGSDIKTNITSEIINITYPEIIEVNNSDLQKIIRATIIKVLRKEAKEFLPEQTLFLAGKLNFKFNKVFIKNNKTLWGSCSGKNNINLNLHLLRLPDHLIDYVIIHELCHTVQKNHGKQFWKLMDSILGDSKKISKELRNYSIQIY